jgi:hypothetical protein
MVKILFHTPETAACEDGGLGFGEGSVGEKRCGDQAESGGGQSVHENLLSPTMPQSLRRIKSIKNTVA